MGDEIAANGAKCLCGEKRVGVSVCNLLASFTFTSETILKVAPLVNSAMA